MEEQIIFEDQYGCKLVLKEAFDKLSLKTEKEVKKDWTIETQSCVMVLDKKDLDTIRERIEDTLIKMGEV